jgi:hypothetical protein
MKITKVVHLSRLGKIVTIGILNTVASVAAGASS